MYIIYIHICSVYIYVYLYIMEINHLLTEIQISSIHRIHRTVPTVPPSVTQMDSQFFVSKPDGESKGRLASRSQSLGEVKNWTSPNRKIIRNHHGIYVPLGFIIPIIVSNYHQMVIYSLFGRIYIYMYMYMYIYI